MHDYQEERESEKKLVQGVSKAGIHRENKNPEFQHELQLKEKSQKRNDTGLPDHLKLGIENLSGHSMDDVKVYYNSSKPAQLNAHAYAQGNQIHLGGGQEKHLTHEAWHIVQQKQGRVKPTVNVNGAKVNDDVGLEKEADIMGGKALQIRQEQEARLLNQLPCQPQKIAQLAPMPSMGEPETHGLYNALESSKKVAYKGTKPLFGSKLYQNRLDEYAGMRGDGLIMTKTTSGSQAVSREFVQLDHDPSWNNRLNDLESFPNEAGAERLQYYSEQGLYKQMPNENYVPTVYAARMYYNDYETLIPSSGGLNASGGAGSAGEVGHEGTFSEEATKEFVLHHFGALSSQFIAGMNIEDGGGLESILNNIGATINRLKELGEHVNSMSSDGGESSA